MSNIIIDSFRFGSDSPVTPSLGYGLLYNWYAATDARGVAPSGFQVPTLTQLQTLQTFLGGESVAGGKLKSIRSVLDGDPYWDAPNTGATNEFDFNYSRQELDLLMALIQQQSKDVNFKLKLWVVTV